MLMCIHYVVQELFAFSLTGIGQEDSPIVGLAMYAKSDEFTHLQASQRARKIILTVFSGDD